MLKRILPLVIVAIGVAAFVALKATRPAPPPVEVEEREWRVDAATVSLSAHSPVLSLYGAVVAPDRVTLTAPLAGHIARRPVRDGQRVEAGDLLVALDDADVAPVVATAEAEVQRLDAEIEAERVRFESDRQALAREQSLLANARSQLDRMRSLVQRNLASRAELDQDENEIARAQVTLVTRQGELDGHPARVAQLQAQRASAQAALDEARRDARRSRAEAPFDGIVTAVEVAPGDRVGEGEALLDLVPVEGLEVRARIPASVQREVIEALAAGEVRGTVSASGVGGPGGSGRYGGHLRCTRRQFPAATRVPGGAGASASGRDQKCGPALQRAVWQRPGLRHRRRATASPDHCTAW